MQFIEKSFSGVRAAVYRLERSDWGLQFLVCPMIHIGSPDYYVEIQRRLTTCEAVLYEGVSSRRAHFLTRSYRLVTKRRDLGLVVQPAALW